MALVLRNTKGSALTYNELDGNFTFITSSFIENESSSSMTVGTASYISGVANILGVPAPQSFQFIAGSDSTDSNGFKIVNVPQISGKTLGVDCFITATVSGSSHSTINVVNFTPPALTFTSSIVSSDFHYHIMYY